MTDVNGAAASAAVTNHGRWASEQSSANNTNNQRPEMTVIFVAYKLKMSRRVNWVLGDNFTDRSYRTRSLVQVLLAVKSERKTQNVKKNLHWRKTVYSNYREFSLVSEVQNHEQMLKASTTRQAYSRQTSLNFLLIQISEWQSLHLKCIQQDHKCKKTFK